MRYMAIIFLDGSDYDQFEAECMDVVSGIRWINPAKALEYLTRWDYGDDDGEIRTNPVLAEGHDNEYETSEYLVKWSRTFGMASLWRKLPD